jgi:hypothetical protein
LTILPIHEKIKSWFGGGPRPGKGEVMDQGRFDNWMDEQMVGRGEALVDSLERLAEKVKRQVKKAKEEGLPERSFGNRSGGWSDWAGDVVHEVQWGVANLGLDILVKEAANADRQKREYLPVGHCTGKLDTATGTVQHDGDTCPVHEEVAA